MNKLNKLLTTVLFSLPALGMATHYEPWIPNRGEVQGQADYSYQDYRKIKSGSQSYQQHAENSYVHVGAMSTLLDRVCGEAEYAAFTSSYVDTDLVSDYFKLTGRYQWFDNLCGDCFSMTSGLSLAFPTEHALSNPGEFHHGDVDISAHVAFGKIIPAFESENPDPNACPPVVKCRGEENYWAMLELGHGSYGNLWMDIQAAGEKQFLGRHFLRLLGDYNHGFGHQKYDPDFSGNNHGRFQGYANMHYDAVDVKGRYTFLINQDNSVSAEYGHRLFARNCPGAMNIVTIAYNVAF
ncbi:MAG: hypothetical protein JHC93_04475 [Parachlamydiales bacterium]|nr:hypothetical protein [Parachlamydiales bacterium]